MGCICSKKEKNLDVIRGPAVYSWDKIKDRIDLKDFTLENSDNTEQWRLPGTINGQQFVIRNCNSTNIYIFDHINTLTIDDCNNCKFILGPVKGSIFVRNCSNCSIMVACGQFRMRDCINVNVFVCCPTQPIIESSRQIHFGCYQLFYNQLKDQFKSAELSVFNNNWNNVHDFTPSYGDVNWCILPTTMKVSDYFSPFPQQHNPNLNISLHKEMSIVPLTAGAFPDPSEDTEICLVVFFYNSKMDSTASLFIKMIMDDRPQCQLVTSREVVLEPKDAAVVFGSTSYDRLVQSGQLIGLILVGSRVIYFCQKVLERLPDSHVYISSNPCTATAQAASFSKLASMMLTL